MLAIGTLNPAGRDRDEKTRFMADANDQLAVINQIYATAIDPERFDELVDIWTDKLIASGTDGFKRFPGDSDRLLSHAFQADALLSLGREHRDLPAGSLFAQINSEPRPTIIFDSSGTVQAANEAAELHFGLTTGQKIDDWLLDAEQARELVANTRQLVADDRALSKSTPQLLRIWSEAHARSILLSLSATQTPTRQRLVLLQSSNFYWPDHLNPIIAKAFELTPAEVEVVKLIVEGASIQEVSDARGSTVSTVRSHIKSIYAKTETKNQAEFLRMTLGLATLHIQPRTAVASDTELARVSPRSAWPGPENERMFMLPDGRVLEYTDCGPKAGRPCVYFHNDHLGNIWPSHAAKACVDAGLRIITPTRAYYGRSSPYPDGATNYEQTPDDIAALLAHLELSRVLLVSITIGGMFACAFTKAYPDLCVGHVSIAPAIVAASPEEEAEMPKIYQFLDGIVKRYPSLLETFLKLGRAYHKRVGSVRYMKRVWGDVPADIAVVQDEDNLKAMLRGLEFSGTYGHLGMFHDYKSILPDSNQIIIQSDIPLYAIIGTEEKNSRLKRTDRLIEQGADIEKVLAAGGGSLLLYSHADLVVQTLVRAWAVQR